MKLRRILPFLAVTALLCPALLARGLDKYKKWPDSPQGYFMTNAERAEWRAAVKTDAEAEQFIAKFLAARDAGFPAMVADRAAQADKHLTVAGKAGSLTTRGKIAIVLGPPAAFNIGRREVKGERSSTIQGYSSAGEASTSGGTGPMSDARGPTVAEMADVANRSAMSVRIVHDYAFTYAGDALPVKQAKDLVVAVEVDPVAGTDKINDRRVVAQLDDQFEAAAAASRVAK